MILDKEVLILAYARFESSIIKCLHTNNWWIHLAYKIFDMPVVCGKNLLKKLLSTSLQTPPVL